MAWEVCTPPTWQLSHLPTTSVLAGKAGYFLGNETILSVMSAQVRQRQQQHDVQQVQRHQPVHQHPVYLGQLRRSSQDYTAVHTYYLNVAGSFHKPVRQAATGQLY